jgi:hypothetical protein
MANIFFGICTQTDWNLPIHNPVLRSLLLLLLIAVNSAWVEYARLTQSLQFFQVQNEITNDSWQRSHVACLDAICRVSQEVHFDCKVDETGETAHMTILDEQTPTQLPFAPEIAVPQECIDAVELVLGEESYEYLYSFIKTKFQFEAINLFHYYENPEIVDEQDGEKKKAIFQLLPGQCAFRDILQQSWHSIYGDDSGDPPPPLPLIDFSKTKPKQIVHVETNEMICFRERFQDGQSFSFWFKVYKTVVEYRHFLCWASLFTYAIAAELVQAVTRMVRLLPLTICIVGLSSDNDRGNRFLTFWKVLRSLSCLCFVAMAASDSDHAYLICILAAGSIFIYDNSKAAMEWMFLHLLSYLLSPESGYFESMPFYELTHHAHELLDTFVPVHHKFAVIYMIYMTFPQLGRLD